MRQARSILIVIATLVLVGGFGAPTRAQDAGNAPGTGAHQPDAEAPGNETIYFFALDSAGKAVTDLKAEELDVRVGGAPVKIARLLPPEMEPPLTLDVVLDVSGNRREQLPGVEQRYAYDFFEALLRPGDRAFVWEFSNQPRRLTSSFDSTDPKALAAGVARESDARGSTALFDAIFAAYANDLQVSGGRGAVLAVTDGDDNISRYGAGDIEDDFRRENLQFFVVNVGRATPDAPVPPYLSGSGVKSAKEELGRARMLFKSLAESAAGGSVVEVANKNDFHEALDYILEYLRNEYAVTFTLPADVSKKKARQFAIGTSRPGVIIVGPRDVREIK